MSASMHITESNAMKDSDHFFLASLKQIRENPACRCPPPPAAAFVFLTSTGSAQAVHVRNPTKKGAQFFFFFLLFYF